MGDRGQVEITGMHGSDASIYLYTHWGASELEHTVANALARGTSRWNDDEYLNRIIFSEMIQNELMDETGYGIGLGVHGDVYKLVVVNYSDNTIGIKQVNYDNVDWNDYNSDDVVWDWTQDPVSFSDFVTLYSSVSV